MALGGGSFTAQNKVLPGTYINFVSAASASAALAERGTCTIPLELDWGVEGKVFQVTSEEYRADCRKLFGYGYDHEKMKGITDLFQGARVLYAYRLNGGGEKAENAFAVARYGGVRGNDLKTVIRVNGDDPSKFDVMTYLGTSKVDSQTVAAAGELAANDYVEFKADAELAATASAPLEGGTNGKADQDAHQAYRNAIESYTYNTMGVTVTDEAEKKAYVEFNKRMRDEMGIKFQLVAFNMPADYMGVINVKNRTTDQGWPESSLVYWVTGAECGCAVNKSIQNMRYDGGFAVDTAYTQKQLAECILQGEFVMHNVNNVIRVLEDVNSMVTVTDTEGDVFKDNQTVRVIDQLGNEDAVLFNTKYLGMVPNNDAGRISLWSDLVKIRQKLQDMGAIENFTDTDVAIERGEGRKSVVVNSVVEVTNTMARLYMTSRIA